MSLALKGLRDIKWEIVDLPDLVFFQEGPGVRKNQYTNDGIKLLNVANLQKGNVDLSTSERYISKEEAYGRYKHFLVDEGDLIIASSGIKIDYFENKMGFITKDHLPLCMNTSTIRFKSLDEKVLNIRYFMYFLKTNYFKKQLQRLITGSAQLNFGPSHLKQTKVILPEIGIQNRIVDLLDTSQNMIDKRHQQIKALSALKQSVFYDILKKSMKQKIKLKDVIKVDTLTIKDFTENPEYYLIGIENIEKDTGRLINYEKVSETSIKGNKHYFNDNHILYSKIRPYLNKVAYPTFEGVCSTDCYPLLVDDTKVTKEFVILLLRSREFVSYATSQSTGANIPRINKTKLLDYEFSMPKLEMQMQMKKKIKEINKSVLSLESSLHQMNLLYNSTLHKAFNGELFKE